MAQIIVYGLQIMTQPYGIRKICWSSVALELNLPGTALRNEKSFLSVGYPGLEQAKHSPTE